MIQYVRFAVDIAIIAKGLNGWANFTSPMVFSTFSCFAKISLISYHHGIHYLVPGIHLDIKIICVLSGIDKMKIGVY